MNGLVSRLVMRSIRRIVPSMPSSSTLTVGSVVRSPQTRLFSQSFRVAVSNQEHFEEMISRRSRNKPSRKRRTVSAEAAYNVHRDRLPQVKSIALSESLDLHSVMVDPGITNLFHVSYLDEEFEDAVHLVKKLEYTVNPTELSEIFVFEDGVVVFWNVDIQQRAQLLRDLERHMDSPYESHVAHGELDTIPFVFTEEERCRIKSDCFVLSEERHTDPRGRFDGILERYALSHAFAASVKVGVWESLLNDLSGPLAETTKVLKKGNIPWNRKEALRRAGEFAALRHSINLNCQLLNKDFYWERADLEEFYDMTSRHLTLERRLKLLNTRLDYCEELVRMVDNMLALRHASTLEWMIIVLIVIEVFFDVFHFIDSTPKHVIVIQSPAEVTVAKDVATVAEV